MVGVPAKLELDRGVCKDITGSVSVAATVLPAMLTEPCKV